VPQLFFDPNDDDPDYRPKAGDQPAVGDWDGDGRDDIGVFRVSTGKWYLDRNNNRVWDGGDEIRVLGFPKAQVVVGDWNGDGIDDIGIFRGPAVYKEGEEEPGSKFSLDTNGNGVWDKPRINDPTTDTVFYFFDPNDENQVYGPLAGDRPVVADWNGDGKDDIGIFRHSQGEWFIDRNGNRKWDGTTAYALIPNDPFDDLLNFGGPGDQPAVGNWRRVASYVVPEPEPWQVEYLTTFDSPYGETTYGNIDFTSFDMNSGDANTNTPGDAVVVWAGYPFYSLEELRVPRILSPASSTLNPLTFKWDPIVGAARYELWVTALNAGENEILPPIIHEDDLILNSYTPPEELLAVGTTYRAKVRALDRIGNPPDFPLNDSWSDDYEFSVVSQFAGLEVPVITFLNPVAEHSIAFTPYGPLNVGPTVWWTTNNYGYSHSEMEIVSEQPGYSNTISNIQDFPRESGTFWASYLPKGLAPGDYKVHVRVKEFGGQVSLWTNWLKIKIVDLDALPQTHKYLYAMHYLQGQWGDSTTVDVNLRMSHDVALDDTGDALLLWRSHAGSFHWNRFTPQELWTSDNPASDISAGSSVMPKIIASPLNHTLAVWMQPKFPNNYLANFAASYSPSYPPPDYWQAEGSSDNQTFAGVTGIYSPNLAVDGNGNVIAVWLQSTSPSAQNYIVMANRYTPNGGWGTPVQLDGGSTPNNPPAARISMNSYGQAVVVWPRREKVSHYDPGNGWVTETPFPLSIARRIGGYAAAAIDESGNITLISSRRENRLDPLSRYDLFAKRRLPDGSWCADVPIETDDTASAVGASIVMDKDGNAVVAWVHAETISPTERVVKFYSTRYDVDSYSWDTKEQLILRKSGSIQFSSGDLDLEIDDQGNVVAKWIYYLGPYPDPLAPDPDPVLPYIPRYDIWSATLPALQP